MHQMLFQCVTYLPPSLFQDINKRLSLPADIRLPEGYLEKFAMNSPPFDKPMSRRLRRASLVSAQRRVFVCLCAKQLTGCSKHGSSAFVFTQRNMNLQRLCAQCLTKAVRSCDTLTDTLTDTLGNTHTQARSKLVRLGRSISYEFILYYVSRPRALWV